MVSCAIAGSRSISPSLYDMDIIFDPPGSQVFSEVYLYEELMEADLHAIVSAFTVESELMGRFAPVNPCRTLISNPSFIKRFVVSK